VEYGPAPLRRKSDFLGKRPRRQGCLLARVPQGDHEGRPYISSTTGIKCRGDPRGRPASLTCKNPTRTQQPTHA